ncbi:Flp family type IVb pilin [Altererythrobacter luteolus]|uniref:Flp family type IVb pilin n=1 Tax=Pontixanthobacter luteolus TaxID=295089 RepID=A0A6I4V200_9SPHN|nr:Flp family type IVb pilin [Pontixanthobacter luteolus]MXP48329.1 Flp family type IVb pilin [Pontixanthobacter luteolus]
MKTFLKTFATDESGASAAEYALILAIVGAAIATAAGLLGGEIRDAINNAETNVANSQNALPAAD